MTEDFAVFGCRDAAVSVLVHDLVLSRMEAFHYGSVLLVFNLPESVNLVVIDGAEGLSYEQSAGDQVVLLAVAVLVLTEEGYDAVAVGCEVEVDVPLEVPGLYGSGVEGDFNSVIVKLSDVAAYHVETGNGRDCHIPKQVSSIGVVVINCT